MLAPVPRTLYLPCILRLTPESIHTLRITRHYVFNIEAQQHGERAHPRDKERRDQSSETAYSDGLPLARKTTLWIIQLRFWQHHCLELPGHHVLPISSTAVSTSCLPTDRAGLVRDIITYRQDTASRSKRGDKTAPLPCKCKCSRSRQCMLGVGDWKIDKIVYVKYTRLQELLALLCHD